MKLLIFPFKGSYKQKMLHETAFITSRPGDGKKIIWRLECPNTPLGACLDDVCTFHTAAIFESARSSFSGYPGLRVLKITRGDWPSMEIESAFSFVNRELWKAWLRIPQLQPLKVLCQKAVRRSVTKDRHTLFKLLLTKKYHITLAELDAIDTQLEILLDE